MDSVVWGMLKLHSNSTTGEAETDSSSRDTETEVLYRLSSKMLSLSASRTSLKEK